MTTLGQLKDGMIRKFRQCLVEVKGSDSAKSHEQFIDEVLLPEEGKSIEDSYHLLGCNLARSHNDIDDV